MLDNEPGAANSSAPGTDIPTTAAESAAAADPTTSEAPAPRRARRRATKATKAAPAEATPATGDAGAAPAAAAPADVASPADAAGTAEPAPARTARRRRRTAEPVDQAAAPAQPVPAAAGSVSAGSVPAGSVPAGSVPAESGSAAVAAGPDTATDRPGDQAESAPAARTTRTRRRATKAAPAPVADSAETTAETTAAQPAAAAPSAAQPAAAAPNATQPVAAQPATGSAVQPAAEGAEGAETGRPSRRRVAPTTAVLFMPPTAAEIEAEAEAEAARASRRRRGRRGDAAEPVATTEAEPEVEETAEVDEDDEETDDTAAGRRRRRRGRRGRGRGKGGYGDEDNGEVAAGDDDAEEAEGADEAAESEEDTEAAESEDGLTRRRRRRRRKGSGDVEVAPDDPANTVVKIREPRPARDEVQGVSGSTRLEAKRQRRRDGREHRRTRPPILSESEFLARREAVDRIMVVRQKGDRTQIGVLEDGILVEHYVSRASASTMVGNVYLGRVQNVLPSMEAAFVDIGRGRNAVLYAGEVNWEATGLEGRTRTIEQALKSGDSVLVQVTKDPIGTKGARLTSHIALSGRHLVYVPGGNASGISRKLPDTERKRLRDVLKHLVPEGAGVIVRTAAEGASEDDLARDVKRLQAQWEDIAARTGESGAPKLLYEEPDLLIRVVRDLFNEDFRELVIQGDGAYEMIEPYLQHVSPDLVSRVHHYTGTGDVFHDMRIDEQLMKALDRRVFLPSGGSLVIDRTEAMTVIDVNTGKYTGTGGNLEETVTRNNLEAAEEIVRQLRLRDLGGIIVIDFIDMVLESNRELVLRRLTECLGRDRTKHQVTEITSLGLVQMTRKRVGQGLLEAFSETCEVCKGRGLIIHSEPVPDKRGTGGQTGQAKAAPAKAEEQPSENGRGGRRRRKAAAPAEPVATTAEPAEPVVPATEPVEPTVVAVESADQGVPVPAVAEATADEALVDGHEATVAGLDPVPAVGFDEDGLDLEEEPAGPRRRGRRRR
ncbi:Rne/Rng family ribonuclease [Planosporangium sp. 12N6]|uniref:Rne/Rng family ribonuclease n=1 Tax=Planosporangium spinosum TaxID=3402278 RepID=UPI003CE95FBC